MGSTIGEETVFFTLVMTDAERAHARLLIDSIRSFAGALSHSPIWLFEANPEGAPCGGLQSPGVQILPLSVQDDLADYYYARKVAACARAEEMAATGVRSLVFLAPENLIIQPPLSFDLGKSFDVAVRPVHIQNVGLRAAEPVDDYWQGVYRALGVPEMQTTVHSFVDGQHLRAYYNSAAFAVNPSKGLCRAWFAFFRALVRDQAYQASACQDVWHQVFLHQAVLSTLIATTCDRERVRTLPPDYVYPYNLHQDVPPERRARVLDDLVCIYSEGRSLDPNSVNDIDIGEPLRSWLASHTQADPTLNYRKDAN